MIHQQLRQKLEYKVNSLIGTQNIIIQKYNFEGWLSNFTDEQRLLAYRLLYGFVFISESMTDLMLVNAISNLSSSIYAGASQTEWKEFIDSTLFAPIRTHGLNFSDSGNLFVGKIKNLMPIDESRIIGSFEDIIKHSADGKKIILVDDFVGSGDQFIEFIKILSDMSASFLQSYMENIIYVPLVSTKRGYDAIRSFAPAVKFEPLYILSDEYCINSSNSIFWRGMNKFSRGEKINQIIEISKDLGIQEDLIFGYKDLGLGIAFQHKTPDATLPIFRHAAPKWIPLVGG